MNPPPLSEFPTDTTNQMNIYQTPQLIIQTSFPELANLQRVNIIQEVECIDCLCPYCTQNKYKVINPLNKQKLFDFKEDSLFLERYCSFSCRGFTLKINNTGGSNIYISMEGEKAWSLPCLCFNGCGKPTIKASFNSPKRNYFGSVKMDYDCCCFSVCNHKILIRDRNNNSRFYIKPNCYCIGCHIGIFAKCCDILFNIYEGNQIVGTVTKLFCSSFFTFCPKGDNYTINFPKNALPEEKFMIILATILLDYLSFYV